MPARSSFLIVDLQLENVRKMLAANGITLQFTDEAVTYLAERGYDPQFGARPVKRVIQDLVLNELSKEILGGKINRERPVVVGFDGSKLNFEN